MNLKRKKEKKKDGSLGPNFFYGVFRLEHAVSALGR